MPEIMYMECRGCGEVFEQTNGSTKPIPEAMAHAKSCSGGFRRNLTEDEAF
jgi:hypothetical protein